MIGWCWARKRSTEANTRCSDGAASWRKPRRTPSFVNDSPNGNAGDRGAGSRSGFRHYCSLIRRRASNQGSEGQRSCLIGSISPRPSPGYGCDGAERTTDDCHAREPLSASRNRPGRVVFVGASTKMCEGRSKSPSADRPLAHFGEKLVRRPAPDGSSFSDVGPSGKPVQFTHPSGRTSPIRM